MIIIFEFFVIEERERYVYSCAFKKLGFIMRSCKYFKNIYTL